MKFSKAFVTKLARSEIYDKLLRLHELQYKINVLDTRFSGRAEELKENYKAEFYELVELVLDEIIDSYNQWIYDHSEEGFMDAFGEVLPEMNGVIKRFQGEIDIKRQVILAAGFNEDKDINNNNVLDVVEIAKLGLDAELGRKKLDIEEKKVEIAKSKSAQSK